MISLYVNALLCTLQHTDTAELHRVYDNMLQRAQKCTNVQGRSFSAPSLTSKYFAFEFV